jgi:hypothetical protein
VPSTPAPVDRLWGLTSTGMLTGILAALSGVVVALVVAFFGDHLGLPGLPLGVVVFMIFALQAVLQVTRLTFTGSHLLRDRWLVVVRRRVPIRWDQIEALRLFRDEENESTARWSLLLRPGSPAEIRSTSVDLLNAGDTSQQARTGWWRTRHLDRHARLLATFHAHGIPLIDSKDPDGPPKPIDESGYAQFVWHHIVESDEPPPMFR